MSNVSYTEKLLHALAVARVKASKEGLDFGITHECIKVVWVAQGGLCALSGHAMSLEGWGWDNPPHLDLVDYDKGYVGNNVRWVCDWVSKMKGDCTSKEFEGLVRLLYQRMNSKEVAR